MEEQVALYARVSSERQSEERTIESQLETLREYAKEHGYQIDDKLVFVDNGVSGATLIRPGLEALRDGVAAGEIDRILILCPDRFARKHTHQLILAEEFERCGVELEFVNHSISSSPEDQLLFQIQGVIAEYEREKIMERSRRGKVFKARQQHVCVLSTAPYGYEYVKKEHGQDAQYRILPEQAAVVKRVFQAYTLQRQSMGTIAKQLMTDGIVAPKGASFWHRSAIQRILTNPAYIGQAAYGKHQSIPRKKASFAQQHQGRYPKSPTARQRVASQQWITIAVPRIIVPSLFQRAQQQIQENIRLSTRNNKRFEYLLSGLLVCEECGYSLHGVTTKSPRSEKYRSYYHCTGAQAFRFPNGRRCSAHFIRSEILEDLVWKRTQELIEQPELILAEYSERTKKKEKTKLSINTLLLKKKKELRRVEREKSRLLDLYQGGTITKEDITSRLADCERRFAAIQEEFALLENDARQEHQQLQLIDQFQHFKKQFDENINKLSFAQKKHIIRLLVTSIIVNCRTAKITLKHLVPVTNNVFRLCPDRVIASAIYT